VFSSKLPEDSVSVAAVMAMSRLALRRMFDADIQKYG